MQNSEEISKLRNDEILDSLNHEVERLSQRVTIHDLRLVDSYLEGKLKLLIMFRSLEFSVDYVAYLQRFDGAIETNMSDEGKDAPRIAALPNGCAHSLVIGGSDSSMLESHRSGEQQPVLVNIIQSAEPPEKVIPSLVWFESVDAFNRRVGERLYYATMLGRHVIGLTLPEWEKDALLGSASGIGRNQLEGQVIKSTPEIEKNIASNNGDHRRDFRNRNNLENLISRYRLYLTNKELAVFSVEGVESDPQLMEVFIGPLDFQQDAGDF